MDPCCDEDLISGILSRPKILLSILEDGTLQGSIQRHFSAQMTERTLSCIAKVVWSSGNPYRLLKKLGKIPGFVPNVAFCISVLKFFSGTNRYDAEK